MSGNNSLSLRSEDDFDWNAPADAPFDPRLLAYGQEPIMGAIDAACAALTAATRTFRAVAHNATPAVFEQVAAAREAQEAAAAQLGAELDDYLR